MRAEEVRRDVVPVPARPPLVGRDTERAQLTELLGHGRHLLLEGPAGVGKTRLAEEVVTAPPLRHRPVDRLLACAGTTGVALAAMLPLTAGRSAREGVGAQLEWYLGRWRAQRTPAAPTLVWVDDVHHLDAASAALLRQAVAAGDVQLLGTLRTHEALPEDLVSLLTSGMLDRVTVAPLDPAAACLLATQCAPAAPSAAAAERIARLAAGNPLFVRELALSGGGARLPRDGPGSAVLRDRLDRLPPDDRRAAELVALAQPVPAALLAQRGQQLDTLLRAGLLVTHQPDLLRLDHPLQAEWLVQALGHARSECYRELAECAARAPGLVDPLLRVEWQLGSHQPLDPAQAARAVRLALARTDVRAARRLLVHVDGEHDLLLGQALAIDGDLDRGLELLEQVRREAADPALRVEAASLLVRHLGLTRNDPARAHRVLDRTDGDELDVRLRRHLLLGRVWLRLFGPDLGPRITPASDLLIDPPHDQDQLAYDLASSCAALFCQTAGPKGAGPFLRRAQAIERRVDVDEDSWCRTRAVEAWWQTFSGDLASARRIVADGVGRAWEQGWREGLWLLVGNAALIGGLAGQPHPDFVPAGWDHRTLGPAGPADGDLYRFRALAEAAWKGGCALSGADAACPCRERALADSGGAMPLLDAMVARAEDLVLAGRGEAISEPWLPGALARLAENDMQAWLAVFYLDGTDLRSPSTLHRLVVDRLRPPATGLLAMAREVGRARAEGDAPALLAEGRHLASRGFLAPATRVLADVTRCQPDAGTRVQAVRALAAATVRWQGAAIPWTRDVPGLPTRHQLDIVRDVTRGAGVRAVADRWCLSRRTVENHVYRVARCLEATGREELGHLLADPWLEPAAR